MNLTGTRTSGVGPHQSPVLQPTTGRTRLCGVGSCLGTYLRFAGVPAPAQAGLVPVWSSPLRASPAAPAWAGLVQRSSRARSGTPCFTRLGGAGSQSPCGSSASPMFTRLGGGGPVQAGGVPPGAYSTRGGGDGLVFQANRQLPACRTRPGGVGSTLPKRIRPGFRGPASAGLVPTHIRPGTSRIRHTRMGGVGSCRPTQPRAIRQSHPPGRGWFLTLVPVHHGRRSDPPGRGLPILSPVRSMTPERRPP
jgi:hypothetical protein